MKGTLFIISSPSGAGKSSLLKALFDNYNADKSMYMSVSHTTRKMRDGEIDGVHYHFVSEDEFKKLIDRNAFYEWAHVFDKYYGTSRELVQDSLNKGQDVFLDIDWQGAQQIRKQEPSAKSVFILPPSLNELNSRLHKRGQDSEEIIAERMNKAQREISHYNEYDYCIINDDFNTSLSAFWSIINAYRHKLSYQESKHKDIIKNLLEGYIKE
jgi:guanylate kinase